MPLLGSSHSKGSVRRIEHAPKMPRNRVVENLTGLNLPSTFHPPLRKRLIFDGKLFDFVPAFSPESLWERS